MSAPKPSEEVKFETSIAMTIIASLSRPRVLDPSSLLKFFPGKRVVLEPSLHFNLGLLSQFSLRFTLSLRFIPGLQSAFYTDWLDIRYEHQIYYASHAPSPATRKTPQRTKVRYSGTA